MIDDAIAVEDDEFGGGCHYFLIRQSIHKVLQLLWRRGCKKKCQ
jgi:hypothetical protein